MNPNDLSFLKAIAHACTWTHSATVYPLITLLRILCAQVLALVLFR
jgi:uncharacterized transporter YbjL